MMRLLAVLLCAALALPGCALRGAVAPQARPGTAASPAPQYITRAYAEKLPVGSKVRVTLHDGQSFSATFMGLEGEAVRLQKRTRIPEEPLVIPLAHLAVLALDQGGIGSARALLIGIGAGVGTFFAILFIVAAAVSD